MPNEPELFYLFPSPVAIWNWEYAEQRKEELLAAVYARRRLQSGIARTNRNGWHSDIDLPNWPDQGIDDLVQWVVKRTADTTAIWRDGLIPAAATQWRINGWANVNPAEGYNAVHHHSARNWHWSACYYLHLPDLVVSENKSGRLIFEDRESGLEFEKNATDKQPREHRFSPKEGQLVVFPSWLHHRVEPHLGPCERVSLAFNLYSSVMERSRYWSFRPRWVWRTFPKIMRQYALVRNKWDQSGAAVPPGRDITISY